MVGFQTSQQLKRKMLKAGTPTCVPETTVAGRPSTSLTNTAISFFVLFFYSEMSFDLQRSCKKSTHLSASLNVSVNILHSAVTKTMKLTSVLLMLLFVLLIIIN